MSRPNDSGERVTVFLKEQYSGINTVGGLIFVGSLIAAVYYGIEDAPAYIHARVIWIAIFGALLTGKEQDEGWIGFLFWTVVTTMVAIGLVATIARWLTIFITGS